MVIEQKQLSAAEISIHQSTEAPLGISPVTFTFLKTVHEGILNGTPIPTNDEDNPVISPSQLDVLTQLIIAGVSLNKLDLGVKKWDLKKRIIRESLRSLATAYRYKEEEIVEIINFFTDDARAKRRLQAGDMYILPQEATAQQSTKRRNATEARKNQKKREKRAQEDRIVPEFDASTAEQYLAAITTLSRISTETETQLISQAMQGDKEAKRQLMLANLYLIADVVAKYRDSQSFADVVSEASLALIEAVGNYHNGDELSLQEFCLQNMRLRIKQVLKDPLYALSLERTYSLYGTPLADLLEDTSPLPEDIVVAKAVHHDVEVFLHQTQLTEVERQVLELKFGNGTTSIEIARRLHLLPKDIEEIEGSLFMKLRKHPELEELLQ